MRYNRLSNAIGGHVRRDQNSAELRNRYHSLTHAKPKSSRS